MKMAPGATAPLTRGVGGLHVSLTWASCSPCECPPAGDQREAAKIRPVTPAKGRESRFFRRYKITGFRVKPGMTIWGRRVVYCHRDDQYEGTDDSTGPCSRCSDLFGPSTTQSGPSKGLVHSRLAIDPKERKVARSHQFSRYANDETPQALLHIGTSVVNLSHDPLRSCREDPYHGQLRRGVQAPGRGSESNCP